MFFILANNQGPGITTFTSCDFILDGGFDGTFVHAPTQSPDLNYRALVYSNTVLANQTHNLTFQTTGLDRDVYVNFDFAIYTYASPCHH